MVMDCREQLTCKILEKLVMEIPILEVDMPKQLEIKNVIANEIYSFEVTSRCTDLVVSDLKEWVAYWLACKKMKNLSQITLKNYTYLMNKFKERIVKPVRMINTMDIRSFMLELKETNGAESICNKLMTLNDFFIFCQEEGAIEKNPVARIERPKFVKNPRKPLNAMQQEILRNGCIEPRERAMYELMISSGARVSEISNANMEDLNMENRTLFIKCGKGGKSRTVKFSSKAKIELLEYIKIRKGNSEAIFVGKRKPYGRIGTRAMEKEINNIKERTKIQISVSPHKLRTTLACNAINQGVAITTIQKLLGHENISTTQRYTQSSTETIMRDYDKIFN